MTLCVPCKDRGRESVAMRVVGSTPMCDPCWKGDAPEDKAFPSHRPQVRTVKVVKEKPMSSRVCSDCGDKLHGRTKGDVCRKCRGGSPASGPKRAGGGKRGPKSSVTVTVTPEMFDTVWALLPVEKKAALLNKLSEV